MNSLRWVIVLFKVKKVSYNQFIIMVLTYLKFLISRNDVKIIIICTITGGILQVISKRYLKNHPEFLEDAPDAPVTKKKGIPVDPELINVLTFT